MIGFFIAATVLLLTALALLLYPLMRRTGAGPEDRQGDVIALSRERLTELKEKNRNGEISDAEYAEQVRDLEAQLADDLPAQESGSEPRGEPGAPWLTIAVVIFIPVLSGLLYLSLGQPRALFPGATKNATAGLATGHATPADVESMVSQLAARLKANPDDPDGWFMLGRSYMVLKRYDKAADVFRRLREMVGDEPEVLVREATALAMTRGGDLSGEPIKLVKRAIEKDPGNAQALWMAATAAYQAQDYRTALTYYQRVEPMLKGEPLQQVHSMLQRLADKGYGKGPEVASNADASGGGTTETSPAPTAPAAADSASLKVNVTLDPSLKSSADSQATVFIFAKAVSGPPMPLAVVRKTVADLPVTVTLDDSQAMMPQLKLSGFKQVKVGARISSSGRPISQPGDLEGESAPVSPGSSRTIDITIDHVVKGNSG